MRHLVVLTALAAALVVAGAAQAGGWAVVGFSPLPDGTAVGERWTPEIKVLQHGETPLTGLRPVIRAEHVASGKQASFAARETDEPGLYRADVSFSSSGEWRLVVDAGWWGEGSTVTYGPFEVEPAPPAAAPRSFPTVSVAAVVTLLALATLVLVGVRRARRLTPAS